VRGCPLCGDVDMFWVRLKGLIDCIDLECMISEKLSDKYRKLLLVNLVSCDD
jgi:hypothetical protein